MMQPPTDTTPPTEAVNPASAGLDTLPTLEMLKVMNENDAQVAHAVAQALPAIAAVVDEAAKRLQSGGRLFYLGAGTSGRLGVLDASECPPTFGVSPERVQGIIAGGEAALRSAIEGAEDDGPAGVADVVAHGVQAGDVLVGISASGNPPYVVEAMRHAREKIGAYTVALTCNPQAAMHAYADAIITTPVGPEVLAGSSRLKAGTSQKMVLNMISTGIMVKLGKTYGNLMVDVQATNAKLRQRALRLVQQVAGVAADVAASALEQAEGKVKPAILIATGRCHTLHDALKTLELHQGILHTCLK